MNYVIAQQSCILLFKILINIIKPLLHFPPNPPNGAGLTHANFCADTAFAESPPKSPGGGQSMFYSDFIFNVCFISFVSLIHSLYHYTVMY